MGIEEDVYRFAKENGLLEDDRVKKLLRRLSVTESEKEKQRIADVIRLRAQKFSEYPFHGSAPSVSLLENPVLLGETIRGGEPVAIQEEELVNHLLAAGRTGSGKTTLVRNMMTQLASPFWAFDRKRDYRHMVTEIDDLLVLPWSKLKFNPLRPPENVPPVRWAQVFTEMYGNSFSLLSGSKNYLLASIIRLYKQYGVFATDNGSYPSILDLHGFIQEDKMNFVRASSDYRDRLLNRLESLELTVGSIFDCSIGYRPEELATGKVVFEIGGLNRDIQDFLQEILLAYIYEYRFAEGHAAEHNRLTLFFDEAKQVFSVYKERQDAAGIPEIDDLTAQMRFLNMGLVALDQEPGKLTESILANTRTKMVLPVEANQLQVLSDALNLTEMQEQYLMELDTGEAILRYGGDKPVPVDLYHFELEEKVSEQQLRNHQEERWENLQYQPRQNEELGEDLEEVSPEQVAEAARETVDLDLSDEAEALLKDIAENPFRSTSQRYEELPEITSTGKGNQVKNKLEDRDLIEEVNLKHDSSVIKLYDVTDFGEKYLEYLGFEFQRKGRGGLKHRYWQKQLKEWFEQQGWTAKRELFDADVYANKGDAEAVVEVAMGKNKRELDHLEKHLEKDFDHVIVACRNDEVKTWIEEKAGEQGIEADSFDIHGIQELLDVESLQ